MIRLFHVARAALALTLLIAAGAGADSVPHTAEAPTALTDMQAARMLIRAGRLEHARAFLTQARPSDEEESIERRFLLGRIEMQLGNPGAAAEHFEAILARRPELTRVRLELARAYYLTGRDDRARHHFHTSLADDLPSSVEAAVESFLRGIDARKRWSASLSASMLPETRRSDREEVLIGGVPFRLSEEARASSGVGALLSAGASFSPVISDDLRGVLAASAAAKWYERSDWNDVSTSGDIGLSRLTETGSVSGGLRLGRRWVGGDGYQRSLGPWAQTRLRLSGSTHLGLALSAGYRKHDERPDRDGWRFALTPRFLHNLDSRTSIRVEPTFEVTEAETDHHGSRSIGLGATIARTFDGGLSVSLSPGLQVRRHASADPLFGTRQLDRNYHLGVRVLHRSLRYRGFAPWIGYTFESNRSNIPIREYRNHGVIAGAARAF